MSDFDEFSALTQVALRHARDAYDSQSGIDRQWRELGYHRAPDFARAEAQYESFAEKVASRGAEILYLPPDDRLSLDGIYVRDAALMSPKGMILCSMGKAARTAEPGVAAAAFAAAGLALAGEIGTPGLLEGGDLVWLDARTCVVGLTYRTNQEGVNQLRSLLGPEIEVVSAPLPHYKGPGDIFHLMSILSPLDRDLALVHSPLMPVTLRSWLLERGLRLLEVPEAEFEAMGCNVLALAPRCCLLKAGLPQTRALLESAGCEVLTYDGSEISEQGDGGPTCLVRPLRRGR